MQKVHHARPFLKRDDQGDIKMMSSQYVALKVLHDNLKNANPEDIDSRFLLKLIKQNS